MRNFQRFNVVMILVLTLLFFTSDLLGLWFPLEILGLSRIFRTGIILFALTMIHVRITDPRIRNYLDKIYLLCILFFFLQEMRYDFTADNSFYSRLLWYLYYVPMTLIPLYCFFIGVSLHREKEENLYKKYWGIWLLGFLLIALMLSNDLHQLAFATIGEESVNPGNYVHGIFYYVHLLFQAVMFLIGVSIIYKKSRSLLSRGNMTLICAVLLLFLGYVFTCIWNGNSGLRLFGSVTVQLSDMYVATTVIFWEFLICIRVIPSNTGYGNLIFYNTNHMEIYDKHENRIYYGEGNEPFRKEDREKAREESVLLENNQLLSYLGLSSGRLYWTIDQSVLQDQMAEEKRLEAYLSEENVILEAENAMLEDSEKLQVQAKVYQQIREAVQEDVQQLEDLLDKSAPLEEILVYGAFIKRKANLLLLSSDNARIHSEELVLSMQEVKQACIYMHYALKIGSLGEKELEGQLVLRAFDAFCAFIAATLKRIQGAYVSLESEEGILRFVISEEIHFAIENAEVRTEDGISYVSYHLDSKGDCL